MQNSMTVFPFLFSIRHALFGQIWSKMSKLLVCLRLNLVASIVIFKSQTHQQEYSFFLRVFLFAIYFFINRLVFSVLPHNIGESATFVTLMKHSWYICFSTHSISGNSLRYCCASVIAKSQLYSSKVFCHIGLEAHISVDSSLILCV